MPPTRNPTVCILPGCCARATTGHATVPIPMPRNSRRLTLAPRLRTKHRNESNQGSGKGGNPLCYCNMRGWPMSASLIGRFGSSTFRLSAIAMSMSRAGSCFSPESAPGPFHHGIRGRGGTIFGSALPLVERQAQADMRTHLIHRPARDIIPPPGGARVSSYWI